MQYEQLGLAEQRELIRGQVEEQERAHYQLVMAKIANTGNDAVDMRKQYDQPIARVETGIQHLHDELHRVDELLAAEAAGHGKSFEAPVGVAQRASAVDGVSQPGSETPAP